MRLDPATAYARRVTSGEIEMCSPVVNACQRHLRDIEEAKHLWLPQLINNFAAVAKEINVDVKGRRLTLWDQMEDWQFFIIMSLLCWIVKDRNDPLKRERGSRRFRHCTLSTPKSAGKTPLMSALGVYMISLDGFFDLDKKEWVRENNVDCYALAGSKEQASNLVLRPISHAVHENGKLARSFKVSRGQNIHWLSNKATGGTLRTLGTQNTRNIAGFRIQYVHAEELSDWLDSKSLDALVHGFKNRIQPLVVTCFNTGARRSGVAWEERNNGLIAAMGDGSDSHFAYICELAENAPLERCPTTKKVLWYPARSEWGKCNPSLGTICSEQYIEGQIDLAKTPSEQASVLRLNFGQWAGRESMLMDWDSWKKAEMTFDAFKQRLENAGSSVEECDLYVGMDLSSKQDISAVAYVFKPNVEGIPRFGMADSYISELGLNSRAPRTNANLQAWEKEGLIKICEGNRISYRDIIGDMYRKMEKHKVVKICSDPKYLDMFIERAKSCALPFSKQKEPEEKYHILFHPQGHNRYNKSFGLWMEHSIESFCNGVLDGTFKIEPSPVLRWNNTSGIVKTRSDGARTLNRDDTRFKTESIDSLLAMIMAIGLEEKLRSVKKKIPSPYENPKFSLYRKVGT